MRLKSEVPPAPTLPIALARWTRERTGSEPLSRVIEEASRAEIEGHACAQLNANEFDLDELRTHPWVSDGAQVTPVVITPDARAFLWRNWIHEESIAAQILARVGAAAAALDAAAEADLLTLFSGVEALKGKSQIAAVRAMVGQQFFMLSGGPGTGKTTTVLRMLLMCQRISMRAGRHLRIAMAAPTGKAAQRLSQSVRLGAEELRANLIADSGDWADVLASVPDGAKTLHRLLGSQPHEDRFRYRKDSPLPYDLVVVDEASMVDLALMRALLDALSPTSTLILIGDPDQLVSVSAGSVLSDLVANARGGPLSQQHARLDHVWRTEGRLAEVYEAVRAGDSNRLATLMSPDMGASWHRTDHEADLGRRLHEWIARPEWSAFDNVLQAPEVKAAQIFKQLRNQQLLCALRDGAFGVSEINRWIDERRRRNFESGLWYPGRPVLVRQNDYNRRLFNGDVGVALWHEDRLQICFETTDAAGHLQYRYLLPNELPEHDLGYALTIHKSQGSEYGHVAVLLPPDAGNRILSRQLLYTAVSRAKRGVELWASETSLNAALAKRIERNGGLGERLAR